jgi:hypothetical protein
MPTHAEYSVGIRLTRQHQPTNIGYPVRLTNAYCLFGIRLTRQIHLDNIGCCLAA